MVPQVKLPLSAKMKSFPIEYVLRQAPVDVRPPPACQGIVDKRDKRTRNDRENAMVLCQRSKRITGAAVSRRDA